MSDDDQKNEGNVYQIISSSGIYDVNAPVSGYGGDFNKVQEANFDQLQYFGTSGVFDSNAATTGYVSGSTAIAINPSWSQNVFQQPKWDDHNSWDKHPIYIPPPLEPPKLTIVPKPEIEPKNLTREELLLELKIWGAIVALLGGGFLAGKNVVDFANAIIILLHSFGLVIIVAILSN